MSEQTYTVTETLQHNNSHHGSTDPSPIGELPPPPVPETDPRLTMLAHSKPASPPAEHEYDLFKLPAYEALQLLSANVELLVRMTGDVPPTPPPKTPTNPQMSDMQFEKANIVRSHSERSLARLRRQAQRQEDREPHAPASLSAAGGIQDLQAYNTTMGQPDNEAIDGVRLKHETTRQASPPGDQQGHEEQPPVPYIIVGADSQPLNLQHGAITRKFYSKNEPPISVNQYLQRLHQFCPMSTAVYLATSLYIHRLAVEERAIPVTRRNAHRLVLAGLRVAMKALEDLSYPHTKIAKVGGVSEVELARLEISFCFLAGFELVVGEELLTRHWEALRDGQVQHMVNRLEVPTLKLDRRPREGTHVAS